MPTNSHASEAAAASSSAATAKDRATAIRQLVAEGLRVKLQQTVLDHYRDGRITIRQGAELLGVTYMEMNALLKGKSVPLMSDISVALKRTPWKGL